MSETGSVYTTIIDNMCLFVPVHGIEAKCTYKIVYILTGSGT